MGIGDQLIYKPVNNNCNEHTNNKEKLLKMPYKFEYINLKIWSAEPANNIYK